MEETLSQTGEEMEVGNKPESKPAEDDFAAQELLQDLSGDDWADTATPPLTSSPRKNLELPLTSETSNMGMILLSTEERQKNTFEGNKSMFLGTLDEKAWRDFLSEFNHETKSESTLDNFKEELWNTVVKFGEPVLIATGLDEKARKELLSKMVKLRETALMILARWKTAAYKGSSEPRRLAEIVKEIEVSTSLVTEEDFKPQKAGSKKGSTNGQTWEVDVGREWISSKHQVVGKQVSNDPLEKNATRNTAQPWWVALETMKELEDCLKKLDHGVSRKGRNWATQQKAKVNKLKLGSQLKRTWQSLLRDYFEEAMRTPSSALPLLANPFVRTARQLMFA